MIHWSEDTIAAIATAQGIGAIGIIRLSGPKAILTVDKIFKGKKLSEQAANTIHFGKIMDKDKVIDEVLVSLFRKPHSYTGEDVLEISAHGSPYVLKTIIELLIENGIRPAKPGEFTLRAFLNKKLDLSQAEAVADLILSENHASHQLAIKQLKGGIKNEIQQLRDRLVEFTALIELELDFSEEDVEFANRHKLKLLINDIVGKIRELKNSFTLGNAIHSGVNTVIAGRPNAGKSTLLNVLVGEERAIVSEIAGTTRDTIEERLYIQGLLFRVIDTAGIREATDQIEALGVARTMAKIEESSILIYVFDVTELSPEQVSDDLSKLHRDHQQIILVPNKMDQNPYIDYHTFENEFVKADKIIPCSAINKMNIDYLKSVLYETVMGNYSLQDQNIITNARHYDALANSEKSLLQLIHGIDQHIQTDFLAQELRNSLYFLGAISGEITNDEILGNIFGKFCIGK
ncbi:MAG: tRNA uridine-5-carboxymethylaminomethyl(34) synthesis GTPase MnmE [Bacteroidota bacterium]|nr:tRNA uridine-5-carboxymethylaminomethyl(34) synthesis GTPase MnmE [Bacteroidota bacterium]